MKAIKISHSGINWFVYIFYEEPILKDYIYECFKLFKLTSYNDLDLNEKIINNTQKLIIRKYEEFYKIDNFPENIKSIERLIGLIQEIIFGPYFLESIDYTFLHGAVVSKNNKATLIIAPTKNGKTTLTSLLLLNNYEYLSDDVIPINNHNLNVLSFPKVVSIRDLNIIKNYGNQLNQDFNDYFNKMNFELEVMDSKLNDYENKKCYFPKNSAFLLDKEYEIDKIYLLKKNNEITKSRILKVEKNISFINLLENLRSPLDLGRKKKVIFNICKEYDIYILEYCDGFDYMRFFNE